MGVPYEITAYSPQKEGVIGIPKSITGADMTRIAYHNDATMDAPVNKLSMWVAAANVNESEGVYQGIDGNDGNAIAQRDANTIVHFMDVAQTTELSDWIYSRDTVIFTSDTTIHVRGIMRGDANRDYINTDPAEMMKKSRGKIKKNFDLLGYIPAMESDDIITIPILTQDEGNITSFQIRILYQDVEIIDVSLPYKDIDIVYNSKLFDKDELIIVWGTCPGINAKRGDTLALITAHITGKMLRSNPNSYFRHNIIGDEITSNLVYKPEWRIAMPRIDIYDTMSDNNWDAIYDTLNKPEITDDGKETKITLKDGTSASRIISVVPNPASYATDITYNIEDNSVVTLQLFDMLGRLRRTLVYAERQQGLYRRTLGVIDLSAGVYFLHLETVTPAGKSQTSVERIIVKK
jgi:hypothetical protein